MQVETGTGQSDIHHFAGVQEVGFLVSGETEDHDVPLPPL